MRRTSSFRRFNGGVSRRTERRILAQRIANDRLSLAESMHDSERKVFQRFLDELMSRQLYVTDKDEVEAIVATLMAKPRKEWR